MDNVQCTGNETDLMSCRSLTTHNCNHAEDAGVICASVTNSGAFADTSMCPKFSQECIVWIIHDLGTRLEYAHDQTV